MFERTGSLDVADDASGRVVHKFDAHLCDTTTGTCFYQHIVAASNGHRKDRRRISGVLRRTGTAQNSGHLHQLDGHL